MKIYGDANYIFGIGIDPKEIPNDLPPGLVGWRLEQAREEFATIILTYPGGTRETHYAKRDKEGRLSLGVLASRELPPSGLLAWRIGQAWLLPLTFLAWLASPATRFVRWVRLDLERYQSELNFRAK